MTLAVELKDESVFKLLLKQKPDSVEVNTPYLLAKGDWPYKDLKDKHQNGDLLNIRLIGGQEGQAPVKFVMDEKGFLSAKLDKAGVSLTYEFRPNQEGAKDNTILTVSFQSKPSNDFDLQGFVELYMPGNSPSKVFPVVAVPLKMEFFSSQNKDKDATSKNRITTGNTKFFVAQSAAFHPEIFFALNEDLLAKFQTKLSAKFQANNQEVEFSFADQDTPTIRFRSSYDALKKETSLLVEVKHNLSLKIPGYPVDLSQFGFMPFDSVKDFMLEYRRVVDELKSRVRTARIKAGNDNNQIKDCDDAEKYLERITSFIATNDANSLNAFFRELKYPVVCESDKGTFLVVVTGDGQGEALQIEELARLCFFKKKQSSELPPSPATGLSQ